MVMIRETFAEIEVLLQRIAEQLGIQSAQRNRDVEDRRTLG